MLDIDVFREPTDWSFNLAIEILLFSGQYRCPFRQLSAVAFQSRNRDTSLFRPRVGSEPRESNLQIRFNLAIEILLFSGL